METVPIMIAVYAPDTESSSTELGIRTRQNIEVAWLFTEKNYLINNNEATYFHFACKETFEKNENTFANYITKESSRAVATRYSTPLVRTTRIFKSGIVSQTKAFIQLAKSNAVTTIFIASEKNSQWLIKILWNILAKDIKIVLV